MPLPQSIGTAGHKDIDLKLVSGRWPDDIRGEMLIAAPGPKGAFEYGLFTPGHVIRLSLQPGSFGAPEDRWAWRSREIETPSLRLYRERPDLFQPIGPGMMSPFGLMNMSNTAVMPWNGRVFTTWDVGRPVEIDPVSLDFLGEVGTKDSWGPSVLPIPGVLPFIGSTAHPVVDPERDCLWSVKLVPDQDGVSVCIVRYDEGREVRVWPVADSVFRGTMHTISQTRHYLFLIDSGNFKPDPGEMAGGPRTILMDDEVPVFMVRKEDVEKTPPGRPVPMKKFMIAPPTGHFYGIYDDSDGVRVMFEHMDGVDLGFFLRPDDVDVYGDPIAPDQVGLYNMGMTPSSLSEIEFDPETGEIHQTERIRGDHTFNNQLSAMDWSLAGLSRPSMRHMIFSGFRPYNVSRRALEAYAGKFDPKTYPDEESPCVLVTAEVGTCKEIARYTYPAVDHWAGSPIFVPRGAGEAASGDELEGLEPGGHDGWVVVPVLRDDGLHVDCFDAARVGDGPIATLAAPNGEQVGLILHSAWLPEARPAPSVERCRFSDDLGEAELAVLPDDDLRALARRVAAELDAEADSR